MILISPNVETRAVIQGRKWWRDVSEAAGDKGTVVQGRGDRAVWEESRAGPQAAPWEESREGSADLGSSVLCPLPLPSLLRGLCDYVKEAPGNIAPSCHGHCDRGTGAALCWVVAESQLPLLSL